MSQRTSFTKYEALQTAIHHGDATSFYAILESENFPLDSKHDYELLKFAIKCGCKSIVHQLLDKGCRVTRSKSTESPLHLAVLRLNGWTNIVEKLLLRGARVADVDAEGNTSLHLAFLHGALDYTIDLLMVKLIDETCENLCNKDGLSVLHIACTRRNRKVVRRLIGNDNLNCHISSQQILPNGASICIGSTPLHLAVCCGRHDIAELLLDHNANLYAQDVNKSTPLHLALYRRDIAMMDILLSYDKCKWDYVDKGLSHFMAACASSNTIVAEEFLLKATSPVSIINARVDDSTDISYAGYSPLHFAAEFGCFLTVVMLVNYGTPYIATQKHGITAMMLAVRNNDDTTCYVLREYYGCECP